MPDLLISVEDGRLSVLIADAKGKGRRYDVAVERHDQLVFASTSGATYRVGRCCGVWWCSCPAWEFHRGDGPPDCKHARTGRALAEVIAAMQQNDTKHFVT